MSIAWKPERKDSYLIYKVESEMLVDVHYTTNLQSKHRELLFDLLSQQSCQLEQAFHEDQGRTVSECECVCERETRERERESESVRERE